MRLSWKFGTFVHVVLYAILGFCFALAVGLDDTGTIWATCGFAAAALLVNVRGCMANDNTLVPVIIDANICVLIIGMAIGHHVIGYAGLGTALSGVVTFFAPIVIVIVFCAILDVLFPKEYYSKLADDY